jgi:dolichol-phosphate mannosyltransferase
VRGFSRRIRAASGKVSRRDARELALFCLVGGSGYVVNLGVFELSYGAGAGHVVAAIAAFLVAVTNNFLLNRRWVFTGAGRAAARVQAPRYLAVSLMAFGVSLGILDVLVTLGDVPAVAAQACAIVVVTPISFVGQKLWSFRPASAWRTATARAGRPA